MYTLTKPVPNLSRQPLRQLIADMLVANAAYCIGRSFSGTIRALGTAPRVPLFGYCMIETVSVIDTLKISSSRLADRVGRCHHDSPSDIYFPRYRQGGPKTQVVGDPLGLHRSNWKQIIHFVLIDHNQLGDDPHFFDCSFPSPRWARTTSAISWQEACTTASVGPSTITRHID